MDQLRVAVGQINVIVGDIEGNVRKIAHWIREAEQWGADLICFPELAVPGYPPEDLLLKPEFIHCNLRAVDDLAQIPQRAVVVVGFVELQDDLFNAAAVLHGGRVTAVYRKHYLPTYGVFDEDRYFAPGREAMVLDLGGIRVGVTICEDLWYPGGPARDCALWGNAHVLVNISSSPYHQGKVQFKEKMLSTRASDNGSFVVYVNLVGGQDELVFDGQSLILGPRGELLARGRAFEEDLLLYDLDTASLVAARLADPRRRKEKALSLDDRREVRVVVLSGARKETGRPHLQERPPEELPAEEEVLRALVLGLRDYVRKNEFQGVVVGLSGGIDSALTAALAVKALGPDAVVGVAMPSVFTSSRSIEDARTLARNLGIHLLEIPIRGIMRAYEEALSEAFAGREPDVTEENIQARIRGNLLMALSNKFGWLVLTTGNKSETSMGYCTLYGDTAGGFAVLKDVPKTMVYALAKYLNGRAAVELIPQSILERPPTAELREGQLDVDSLPPYDLLDPILKAYVEEEKGLEEIVAQGFDRDLVADVIRRVDRNEYKRRQSPPGIKITPRAFGKERRLPITNRFAPWRWSPVQIEEPSGSSAEGPARGSVSKEE